ncbi:MAG: hypothetical protein JJU13_07255 [Balneolaceae bacterium]|nr:hypothetical protein [Balneolaceae bacterium]
MNILLAAEESAGVQTLKSLSKSSHNLKAVLTNTASPEKGAPVAALSKKLGYTIMPATLVKESGFAGWIAENDIDLLLNIHSLFVICTEVIESLKMGAYNLHPGPLPSYTGLNAPSWAVYNQEPQHGVTLHKIVDKIDAGTIIDEALFPITSTDTGLSVSMKCVKHGIPLIEKFLDKIEKGESIAGKEQDFSRRKYYRANQIPHNGKIDWNSSASRIDAFVRACNYAPFQSPWGYPYTLLDGEKISILKIGITDQLCNRHPGTVGETIDGAASIATADNWVTANRCMVNGVHVDACSKLSPGDLLT